MSWEQTRGQVQCRRHCRVAQPYCNRKPIPVGRSRHTLSIPCRTMSPTFDLQDYLYHIYSFPPFSPLFQSQSTPPKHHPFVLQSSSTALRWESKLQMFNVSIKHIPPALWFQKSQQPRLAVHSQPPPHYPTVWSIGTPSFGDGGLGNSFSGCYLGNLSCWFLTGCSLQMCPFLWVFQLPSFPPRESSWFPQPELLLLCVLTLAFKERGFGIIFPLLSRVYKEMGYFEPPEVFCSIVICKVSIQSRPNQQTQAQHL